MKGIALIGMLMAMLIVVFLTLSRLKAKTPSLPASEVGGVADTVPKDLTQLPAQVKSRLNQVQEKDEAERKAAEEVLSR